MHAFSFVALALMLPGLPWLSPLALLALLALPSIPVCGPPAQRRIHGARTGPILARAAIVSVLWVATLLLALAVGAVRALVF